MFSVEEVHAQCATGHNHLLSNRHVQLGPLPTCTYVHLCGPGACDPSLTGCRAPHLPADSMTPGPLSAAPALASQMAMFPMTKSCRPGPWGPLTSWGKRVPLSILQTPRAEGLLAVPPGEVHVHRAGGERQPGRRLGHRSTVSHLLCDLGQVTHHLRCCPVAKSRPALCDPTDYNTPGFPVLHHFSLSLLKLMSTEWMMPSNHLILCRPFSSCPQSFPASGSCTMSWLFTSGGQSIGVSASAPVLPINVQD